MSLTKKDLNLIEGILAKEIHTLKLSFTHFETTVVGRFNVVENRINTVENKIDGVENRINGIEQSVNSLEKTMNKRFDSVDYVLKDIIEAITVDENERYSDHETRIRRLELHNKIS